MEIDAWLKKSRGKNLALKPVRERSLDIFGDEKALDRIDQTYLVQTGADIPGNPQMFLCSRANPLETGADWQ